METAVLIALINAGIAIIKAVIPVVAADDVASLEAAIAALEGAKPKTAEQIEAAADAVSGKPA
jgi:hypothetical protein